MSNADKLRRYRQMDYPLPKTYWAWDMFGAGLEHCGRNGKPVEHPLREPNADEVLLRVDAISLCFSDAKLVWAGNEHPRIRGRDLQKDPTVPGHEAALTVVKAGANWKHKFSVGQRFIIQADVFIKGEQKAFGYVQRGAMAQFVYAGPWVLDGDDGCYLLPLHDKTGYAEAALVEPWACVEHAYHITARTAPLADGKSLAITIDGAKIPTDVNASVSLANSTSEAIRKAVSDKTGGAGFDDIFLIGPASKEIVEAADAALAKDGYLVFSGVDKQIIAEFDIGRVHYHFTRHVAAVNGDILKAYTQNQREELLSGGLCWMAGAAGPMGQMHVQRALELEKPPKMLYCTDLSPERISYMKGRLGPLAKRAGVELICANPKDMPNFEDDIRAITGGKGFDDVYVHAPVAFVVEQCARHVAVNGILNIFAGVALGTKTKLPVSLFTEKHARLLGSSGSSMAAIKGVLDKLESGRLATGMSVAAVGGIESAWLGLKGVKENIFLGKTVLFPFAQNLPLLPIEKLSEASTAAASCLESGSIWTNEAEEAMLVDKINI